MTDSFFDALFAAEFYEEDIILMRSLGLNTEVPLKHGEVAIVGEVSRDGWRVEVSMTPLPAQFWSFDIFPDRESGAPVRLEFGSGTLAQYWPIAELFAEGMVIVKRLRRPS